ncbi:MAG: PHP domain-containing protein [Calditrichaeota bacterium]|nr:PHP domain-containing protein [Calditrichota bacterium]RQV92582.1 MAG: PHP domain-containing protein [bacterium]RQW07580.1 MAG: PHP domain-containing protein [Calditrichota bacterium]
MKKSNAPYYEVVGCIHMHSIYSDGTGTISKMASAANDVGLDYIMVTDHNNLRALANGEEKWYGRVLAIIGYEINDVNDLNHYLAFGLTEEIAKNIPAFEYVKRVKKKGGFGIIAHPDEVRHAMVEHPPYPWTEWESPDYQGIEIWNQMSEWMEGLTPWNKLWRFVNPRRSTEAPVERTLQRWDRVNQKRKVVGIGGVDAHAHRHKMFGGLIGVTIFPYKVQFQTVRTHLLLEKKLSPGMDIEEAKKIIYDAILDCRVFISNYFNGDASGFRFLAKNRIGRAIIGEKLVLDVSTRFLVNVPAEAQVRLILNGELVAEKFGKNIEFPCADTGVYRVEVFRDKRAWIYSNHIRVERE